MVDSDFFFLRRQQLLQQPGDLTMNVRGLFDQQRPFDTLDAHALQVPRVGGDHFGNFGRELERLVGLERDELRRFPPVGLQSISGSTPEVIPRIRECPRSL